MYIFCKKWIRILLIVPTSIFFAIYTLYPILDSLRASFFDQALMRMGKFVGFNNYIRIFQDEYFLKSLTNTFIVLVSELILLLPLGILMGLFLNQKFKGSELVKLLTFTPVILSGIMTGLVWFFILDPGIGLINGFLKNIGLGSLAFKWIGGMVLTPYSVAVVDAWKAVGFYAVVFMAGIKMIPKETYEAATIDGATPRQRTWFITLPLLKETIKVCTVMVIINAINTFQTIYMLTGGGPNRQSNVLATTIYYKEFQEFNFAYGSAMAVIMLILVMGLSITFLNLTQKRVEE